MTENIKIILVSALTLVGALAVVMIVFAIVVRRHMARQRKKVESFGKESEQQVDAMLKKAFGEENVMTGVYLPYINLDYDKFAEIDQIVILRSGVFVIEVQEPQRIHRQPESARLVADLQRQEDPLLQSAQAEQHARAHRRRYSEERRAI